MSSCYINPKNNNSCDDFLDQMFSLNEDLKSTTLCYDMLRTYEYISVILKARSVRFTENIRSQRIKRIKLGVR